MFRKTLFAAGLVPLLALSLPGTAYATVLVHDPITGTNPGANAVFLGPDADVAEHLLFDGISRGSGLSASNGDNTYRSQTQGYETLAEAKDSAHYVTWTLDLPAGFLFDFTVGAGSFSWEWGSEMVTHWALLSSLDGFASALAEWSASQTHDGGNSSYTFAGPFLDPVEAPVEFRLYFWDVGNRPGWFSVNEYTISGAVLGPFPDPDQSSVVASANNPTAGSPVMVTVTAIDPGGDPVVGLEVSLTADPETGVTIDDPNPATTDAEGRAVFVARSDIAQSVTFTASYNPDIGFVEVHWREAPPCEPTLPAFLGVTVPEGLDCLYERILDNRAQGIANFCENAAPLFEGLSPNVNLVLEAFCADLQAPD